MDAPQLSQIHRPGQLCWIRSSHRQVGQSWPAKVGGGPRIHRRTIWGNALLRKSPGADKIKRLSTCSSPPSPTPVMPERSLVELEDARPSPRKAVNQHHCPHCDKAYERPDHLARHLDSHRNERVYQCPICQRGFNRRDVLQRHQAVHEKEETDGTTSSRRTKERAIEACEACATAKLSCGNERPCKRCESKGISCAPRSKGGRRSSTRLSFSVSVPSHSPRPGNQALDQSTYSGTPDSGPSEYSGPPLPGSYPGNIPGLFHASLTPVHGDGTLDNVIPPKSVPVYSPLNGFPAFFEQVMLPGFETNDPMQGTQHPRVFDFMQDTEFNMADSDVFGIDFIPELDKILDVTLAPSGFETPQQPPPDDEKSASQRAAAFGRSVWLWVPEKNQHAFSDEQRLPLRDGDSISSSNQNHIDSMKIPGHLSYQARDDILKLVLRTGGSRLSVATFPSADYLDTLIKIGIGKRIETDAWIHPYTFFDAGYQQLRPELLTALVAAGCVCCGMPSINKTGIVLQEITRVSLAQLVEEDNSMLRDLQYLQASMIWLDIGVFCGYTRKMQIAESYLQPLVTALRRGAAFDQSTYTVITPYTFENNEESLQRAWHAWVRQESLRRLVYHLFAHDVIVAAALNRPALISYTELTLHFPSARDLWLAPDAQAWREAWMTKYRVAACSEFSLRDLLADPSLLVQLPDDLDLEIATNALLQALALQVWEFRQQMLVSQASRSGHRATTRLWLQSRQDDLYMTLQAVQQDSRNPLPVTTLFNEFVMMSLHIDMDAIQRFVGKMGELDARRAYPGLRDWSRTREARTAIWHAGQVIRAARNVAIFQLRGFDSLSLYHATLVLWVYSLLQCGENKRDEMIAPMRDAGSGAQVSLDGMETPVTKSFLNHGIGRPGLMMLQSQGPQSEDISVFCELNKPRAVMAVARQVFKGNCPRSSPDDMLPPMIHNLCALIEDLGSLV
ncbi:hypothetical protein PDE_06006 [Penicillium oxalicum 114-2]|uniref:Uncharacterized protein n=1 Tax=Penicillium oxalicum (strain 114-2 / CGMCC 5302) TaxID=933388 RepID=S8B8H2_PENO1|nr:hypothetical protein PDE_06006 [Penicillium oxalicum 114-2]